MILDQFNNVSFEDSYLLGWKRTDKTIILNVELCLSVEHPLFECYDEEIVSGCYKYAHILITNVSIIDGLLEKSRKLYWDAKLKEYKDVAEIDSFSFVENNLLLIEADDLHIKLRGDEIFLIFDHES